MTKISIVIPVYNSENYLKKCLDSVCNQIFKDLEIICINDCSSDNSLAILQDYANKDNRINIIDFKENMGVSVARNSGIDAATGEYISFVDSDDYIELDFYELLNNAIEKNPAEIIKGGDIKAVYSDGHIDTWQQNDSIRENKINFFAQVYSAIYSKKFLVDNNIRFPENISIGEDIVFITKSAILAKSIEIIDDGIYYYVKRENSLDSKNYNIYKVKSFIEHMNIIIAYCEEFDISLNDKKIIFQRFISQLNQIRKYKVKKDSEEYKLLTIQYQQKIIAKMRLR